MIKPAAFAICLFVSGCLIEACLTPRQQGAIAEGGCTLLAAFVGGPEEAAICAFADDIIAMEADARATRADAGPGKLGRKSGKCQIVGTICLTEEEMASAIAHRKASK